MYGNAQDDLSLSNAFSTHGLFEPRDRPIRTIHQRLLYRILPLVASARSSPISSDMPGPTEP